MAKVTIISGFLGAGKTTLIKKLLKEAFQGEKIVLIENEFGEIGVDGGFLKDAGVEVSEMNSGCICCSLVGDFGRALKEVIDRYSPDRILIEPSGVGKLSDVERAVVNASKEADLVLTASVAVVDANKAKVYMKNFGEFFANQVETAKAIILSRTQLISQEKLEACVALLREHNKDAAIITTPWDDISGEKMVGAVSQADALAAELMEQAKAQLADDDDDDDEDECCGHHHHDHDHDHEHEHHHDHDEHDHDHEHHHDHGEHDHDHDEHDHDHEHHHDHDEHDHYHDHDHECCGHDHDHDHHHHHHHADEVFTSWGRETPVRYTKDALTDILRRLSETEEAGVVLRAKGMVCAEDGGWLYFDMVPGEYEVRDGEPEYTGRICVIGTKLKEDVLCGMFGV